MKSAILLFFFSLVVLGSHPAFSQASDASFDWWRAAFESATLETVSSGLKEGEYQWPNLPSVENEKNGNEDKDWITLSKNFVTILGSHVRKNRASDPADLVRFASEYFSIESALRKSGGYTNQVIANVYAAYGADFLASAIAQDVVTHDKILKLLKTRKSAEPDSVSKFLLEYLQDDPLLKSHEDDVRKIGEDVNNNLILAGMRLQEFIPQLADSSPPETTIGLIDAPAVPVLLSRVTLTEYTLKTLLPGLIQFIELGGELNDLVKGSEKPLRDVLGDKIYDYQFKLLGVRSLSAQAVMNLLEDAQGVGNDKKLLE